MNNNKKKPPIMEAFIITKVPYPLDNGVISNFLNSTGP
jgi:hypothetical protein